MTGVEVGRLKLDELAGTLSMAADTVDDALADRPAHFSWRVLASGESAEPHDLRRLIEVAPVLDFSALQPGRAATETIAQIASDLKLASKYQVRVRQTGSVPIEDDEFGTLTQNATRNFALMLLAVAVILWLALRSWRIIVAVAGTVLVGLAISTAAGLLQVGALNVISVAFFVLFVGLGVDFGIQFSVRYRAERHDYADLLVALRSAATKAGGPLALAAVATAIGFSSFMPTAYRGLSELGQIAGAGMIIAFIVSITLLPALLAILNPPGEPNPVGFCVACAGGSLHRAPPNSRSRNHAGGRDACLPVVAPSAIRFRPQPLAQFEGRVDGHLSGDCEAIRKQAPTRSTWSPPTLPARTPSPSSCRRCHKSRGRRR